MCLRAALIKISLLLLFIRSEANNEEPDSIINIVDLPPVNFNDIFSSHLSMLSDDKDQPKDKEFQLPSTQLVEFHFPKISTETDVPSTAITTAKYVVSTAFMDKLNRTSEARPTNKTVEKLNNDRSVIMPIKSNRYQRGVLDLLFPSYRVKTFKSMFEALRNILSNTFRKR